MNKDLRIVFLGTPEFAVASLDILVKNRYNVVGVVTAPDKPAGRGQQIQQSAVKQYAVAHNLKVLQPEKLKNEEFLNELRALKADLQIIVAFRMLPEVVWNMPRLGTVNLHASLLPQYRGAAPINWAIINGEKETGVSTFFLQHEIDTGNIIYSEKVKLDDNITAGELHDVLMNVGSTLILKTVQDIESGNYPQTPQEKINAGELKHAPKIFKETCAIDWHQSIDTIHNLVRGLSPYPCAHTILVDEEGKEFNIKVYKTQKEKVQDTSIYINKNIYTDGKTYLKVAVDGGFIHLLEVQLAGKKRINIEEFLRGFNIKGQFKVK